MKGLINYDQEFAVVLSCSRKEESLPEEVEGVEEEEPPAPKSPRKNDEVTGACRLEMKPLLSLLDDCRCCEAVQSCSWAIV